MNLHANHKLFCTACHHVIMSDDQLKAPHPFDPPCECYGCPLCRGIDCFTVACDHEGCERESSQGWKEPDGTYRVTCSKHAH